MSQVRMSGTSKWASDTCSRAFKPRARRPIATPTYGKKALSSSVVAEVATDLSPEDPIRPTRVHEDDGQHKECPDQQEGLRARRGRCLPECEAKRHNHRPEADSKAEVRQQK